MTDHIATHQAAEDARNEAILIYVDGRIVPKAQVMVFCGCRPLSKRISDLLAV